MQFLRMLHAYAAWHKYGKREKNNNNRLLFKICARWAFVKFLVMFLIQKPGNRINIECSNRRKRRNKYIQCCFINVQFPIYVISRLFAKVLATFWSNFSGMNTVVSKWEFIENYTVWFCYFFVFFCKHLHEKSNKI